ncbi:MAG TPA: MATE family efflux transporter [Phenylobacterium sp.]|uniref:MATE family efflux transporter n=1 Tax=Phenylobacterium sp. TaxID=1871053 RepID=UPI002B48117D|nr:MATE family efflux transporter [Phenylobacterium sp.]HKR87791.1 MATE family efflux transporter [Phenylobacterium sp.]
MDRSAAPAVSRAGDRAITVRPELVPLLKLAGPVVLARLGIMVMGLSDAIVVGRYSAAQLGYHALGWAPTNVVITMVVGLLSGVQVMTARAVGDGRLGEAGAVLRRGVVYSLWIGLAATLVLMLAGPPFLHAIGLSKDLADGASAPLLIFALSLPPYAVSVAASFWLEGLQRPGAAAWAMWIANGVNLALDLLLVPGTFGLPALGAVGGGCATLGARTALCLFMLGYIARMDEARALGVFDRAPRDPKAEAEQRKIGLGAGLSNFFEVAAFNSLNVIAGWIGALAVAGWAIVLNVTAVVFMAPLGLATAAAVRVGSAYGARDAAGARSAAATAVLVTAVYGVVLALAVWPLAGPIARLYTDDAQTLAIAGAGLALTCLMFLPDALQVVAAQALRARGDVWLPTGTHLTSYIVIMAPLAWCLAIPEGMGVKGLVWAVILASLVSCGLLLARLWQLDRRDSRLSRFASV